VKLAHEAALERLRRDIRRRTTMATYREDMRRAWERINSFPTRRLQTRFGTIEYADQGEGTPLLVSHGVLRMPRRHHRQVVGVPCRPRPEPGS